MKMTTLHRCGIAMAVATGSLLVCGNVALAESLLIRNVTLIDGTARRPVPNAHVLVVDDRIQRVSRTPLDADANARRVDGSGKFLIPGLMDMHIHLKGAVELSPEGLADVKIDRQVGLRALHSYLYSGVTSVYDAGNVPDFILGLRADERGGQIVSPRIFTTGSIVTYPGSHGSNEWGTQVDDWPEAIPALDAHIARQPDILKLTYEERGWGAREMIPILPVPLMQKIIEYYNDHGIRTTVHTSSEYRARQAIFAGIDSLAHPVIQGPITDSFAMLMKARQIPMITTLTIGENYSRLAEHPEYLDEKLYRATLTAEEIEELKTERREEYQHRKWTWWMKIMTTIAQENLRKINEAGGVLVAGTDQSSGPALHHELQLLEAAGIPPADIIRIATLNGAVFLNRARDLGSIEEGKLADMVLLNADPTVAIGNTREIAAVFRNGQRVDRSRLDLPVNR